MAVARYWRLLPDHTTVPANSAAFDSGMDRRVGQDYVDVDGGRVSVSTVFLILDHSFGSGPPLLFETMIFGGPNHLDQRCWRYSTWDEAVWGHLAVVECLRSGGDPSDLEM